MSPHAYVTSIHSVVVVTLVRLADNNELTLSIEDWLDHICRVGISNWCVGEPAADQMQSTAVLTSSCSMVSWTYFIVVRIDSVHEVCASWSLKSPDVAFSSWVIPTLNTSETHSHCCILYQPTQLQYHLFWYLLFLMWHEYRDTKRFS